MNKHLKNLFFAIFSLLAIIITSLVLIIYSGYKIDFAHFRLVKTGSLYINTDPSKADIYLNDKKISQKTPTIINQLNPEIYNLKIVKNGYQEWEQQIKIEPSITSFVNYDLVLKDIELSPTNEFGDNMYYSSNNKYIAYIKNDELENNVLYIYDVTEKSEFNVFETNKKIKDVSWSKQNSKLLLNIEDKLYILDINKIPVINKITSSDLINLSNYLENIEKVYWNENNDVSLIVKAQSDIYYFNIDSKKIELINKNFDNDLIYLNNDIYYLDNGQVIKQRLSDGSLYKYDKRIENIKSIRYENNSFILLDENAFYVFNKDLNNEYIKTLGSNIKLDKNYIISWNDYELNVYDKKEKASKFAMRYSQKILDLDFCLKNYIILILENDIKIVNIGDNINELDIIPNKSNILKVIAIDNKTIYVIYKENEQNMISSIELQ